MQIDFAKASAGERYKLLAGLVVPRPIALVTSRDRNGLVNAAPFSFFNVFCDEPPLCVLGIGRRAADARKDTGRNIHEQGEFVVNMVDEDLAPAMNICAIDFPPDQSEIDAAGLDLLPSSHIATPRIGRAPVSLECRLVSTFDPAGSYTLITGEILALHARDGIVDPSTLRVDWETYRPVGRLFGNFYSRTREIFELRRQSFAEWRARR